MTKRVKDFKPARVNSNRHTARGLGLLENSIRQDGWIGAMTTAADGEMIAGSARIEKAAEVFGVDAEPIVIHSDGSKPILVIRDDIPNAQDERAKRLGLADNRIAALDLSFDVEVIANYSADIIGDLWTPAELSDLGDKWAQDNEQLLGVPKDAKPNPRKLPIDLIFTIDELAGPGAALANAAGWKIGSRNIQRQSGKPHSQLFSVERWQKDFALCFIDNDYHNYVHSLHLDIVRQFKPKYCTVRDIMAREQCKEAGIGYFSFEQIMDWAEELSQYAQNVIVIPKYECLDKIPAKFVLGYSVPTSHGGTPLPVEAFKGRRVHLLGGSWKAQLAHLAALGDDVVSLDNNYIQKQAQFGSYVLPNGDGGALTEDLNLPSLTNPMYVALAISLGSIAAKINELYAGSAIPGEN